MDAELSRLSSEVGSWLRERGARLASAESCTGGWVAAVVTATAGSSAWFDSGFVTYSNGAKQGQLGVSAATLERHGAVSEETVREMARGALARSGVEIALAVSGVAGPTGGSATKPVGTVCFAWAAGGGWIRSETRHFRGDREAVRRQAVIHALAGIMKMPYSRMA